jgi:transcriptional regulator with XRE-family HTH domain
MANLQLIKELVAQKNITLEQLSKTLGITPQAMSKIMRENSTKIDTLERIASELGVSPAVFFETESCVTSVASDHSFSQSGNNNTMTPPSTETTNELIGLLRKRDEQIDRVIDLMQKMIESK